MKKLILAFPAIFLSCGLFAQTDPGYNRSDDNRYHDTVSIGRNNKTSKRPSVNTSKTNGVTMIHGKVMTVNGSKMTPVVGDTILGKGTKVISDGTIIRTNGTKYMLKEGDFVDVSGN